MRVLSFVALMLLVNVTIFGQDSLNVTRISGFRLWDLAEDVAAVGHHAYVAAGFAGLRVVDVVNPADPQLVGWLDLPGPTLRVSLAGHYAYLTGGVCEACLSVVDVQNPLAPQLVGTFRVEGNMLCERLPVLGNLVIVADARTHRLLIVDVSDPTTPVLRGQLETPAIYAGLAVRDSVVFYGTNGSGLRAVDIHDPAAPVEIGTTPNVGEIANLVVQGHYVYVTGSNSDSIHVIDVSDPASPTVAASFHSGSGYRNLAADQSCLYASFKDSLQIVDIANPLQPTRLGSFYHLCSPELTSCTAVAAMGQTVYLGTACNELLMVDVSHPAAPVQAGRYDATTASELWAASVYGDYLYLPYYGPTYQGGLLVADVSDPTRLLPVSALPGDPAAAVLVRGQTAFVASGYCDTLPYAAALVTCDLTNPLSPRPLGWAPLIDFPSHIAMSGRYAYITHQIQYMSIVDEQDSANPVTVRYLPVPDFGLDVAVTDSLLLIASDDGIRIRRAISPDSLPEICVALAAHEVLSLAVQEHVVFASTLDDSFFVVDVTAPSAPLVIGSCSAPYAFDIRIDGDLVYMACDTSGLRILDVTDHANPHEVGYYRTPWHSKDLALRDSVVFLVDDGGVGAYRYLSPVSAHPRSDATLPRNASLSAYPNPFNPTTILSFNVPKSSRVTLNVYDLTGRLVQTLADRVYPQGNFSVNFDGSSLASGIYFARLHEQGFSKTQKLVLLK